MTDIDSFQTAIRAVRPDAALALTRGQAGVTSRSGRLGRWTANFRTGENRRVADCFAQSLRGAYGRDVADAALESSGLNPVMARGKPLRARHVRQVVKRADALLADVRKRNAELSTSFSKPVALGTDVSLLQIKIDDAARTRYRANPTMAQLVDARRVASRVEKAIVDAGRNGNHFVTSVEAAGIIERIVAEELDTAYTNARDSALDRLALDDRNSLAGRALAAAAALSASPVPLEVGRLTSDTRAHLASRFHQAIADGSVPGHELGDEAGLRRLADKVMGEFVAERTSAQAAVAELPDLAHPYRAALLDQVLHDTVPAQLVPAMGKALARVGEGAVVLGPGLKTADAQKKIAAIRDAMSDAFTEVGFEVNVNNQDEVHRQFWRFLLAPAGAAGIQAVAEALQRPESPLRAIGEGASWYRGEFIGTEEAERTFRSESGNPEEVSVYTRESYVESARVAVLMTALADVVGESPDVTGHRPGALAGSVALTASAAQTDETIASLRNLGIPMPAPNRVGQSNPAAPISRAGLDAIEEQLAAHMRSKGGGRLEDGLLAESRKDFKRNAYTIGGERQPLDESAVTAALHAFCTDPGGKPNERLLKNVSMLAYQAGPGCMYGSVLNAQRADIAVFDATPSVISDEQSYEVWREDSGSARGDVLVKCLQSGAVGFMQRPGIGGGPSPDPVVLDPEKSDLRLSVTFRIEAQTCEPRVETAEIGYSLMPGETTPGR